MFAVAERLHTTIGAVLDMTVEEFAHWQAYFRMTKPKDRRGRR